jgi:hypothetical protein
MAQVTKLDGKSYAQSFSRKIETDPEYARQWSDLNAAKMAALSKGIATLTPTSVVVDRDHDPAEAVRLLQEMADKQRRTFEQVFADPANAKLANRTYTSAHRIS